MASSASQIQNELRMIYTIARIMSPINMLSASDCSRVITGDDSSEADCDFELILISVGCVSLDGTFI